MEPILRLHSMSFLRMSFLPRQQLAKNAGKCGIEVEGGKLPTDDWFLNLQILTAGGFQ
jgi:hypothetical protein